MIAYQQARETHLERLSSDGWAGVRAIERHIDGDDLHRDDRQTASYALGEFLRRIISPGDPMRTARRFAVFASIFSPELLGISFSKMSKPLGVTRSALSSNIPPCGRRVLAHADACTRQKGGQSPLGNSAQTLPPYSGAGWCSHQAVRPQGTPAKGAAGPPLTPRSHQPTRGLPARSAPAFPGICVSRFPD